MHNAHGEPLVYTDRRRLTDVPAAVVVADRAPRQVLSWAGPWPTSVPGSAPGSAVRIQVVLAAAAPDAGETALLLLGHATSDETLLWTVEGLYD